MAKLDQNDPKDAPRRLSAVPEEVELADRELRADDAVGDGEVLDDMERRPLRNTPSAEFVLPES